MFSAKENVLVKNCSTLPIYISLMIPLKRDYSHQQHQSQWGNRTEITHDALVTPLLLTPSKATKYIKSHIILVM